MSGSFPHDFEQLERYRPYLRLIADLEIGRQYQGKIDVSGIVQQTLWEAFQACQHLTMQPGGPSIPWLRQILARNLTDEIRKLRTEKRDVQREQSLHASLEQSSMRLDAWLMSDELAPADRLSGEERLLALSTALAALPAAQHAAILLRYIQGKPLADISRELGRSHTAVAGLIKRGLQSLRERLQQWE